MNWFRDRFNNFRLTGSQDNNRLEQEIKPTAYLLWKEAGKPKGQFQYYLKQAEIEIEIRLMTYLMWKKDGKPEDKYEYYEDYYWEKAKQKVKFKRLPIIYKPFYFVVGQPYYFLERKILEPGLAWTDKQAFFDILGRIGNLAIVIGVISFIFTEDSRRNAEVFSAWQTITSAHKQSGSGGRIEALEFLNSRPLRLPFIGVTKEYWYWDKWSNQCKKTWRLGYRFPRQNLSGLSAPNNAYLTHDNGIKLCGADLQGANLQDAILIGANLQDAQLWGANLQDANLWEANLQHASLGEANLQNAYLGHANLQDAYLGHANLQDAYLGHANLQDAYLGHANLRDADLGEANRQDAYLWEANLQDADLTDANLSGAIYTDLKSGFRWEYSSSNGTVRVSGRFEKGVSITIFPDDFDPQKAGMILIRTKEDYDKWLKSRQK